MPPKCGRCGRRLTHPDSIKTGFGRSCAVKEGVVTLKPHRHGRLGPPPNPDGVVCGQFPLPFAPGEIPHDHPQGKLRLESIKRRWSRNVFAKSEPLQPEDIDWLIEQAEVHHNPAAGG